MCRRILNACLLSVPLVLSRATGAASTRANARLFAGPHVPDFLVMWCVDDKV